jgi:hypothetical protein
LCRSQSCVAKKISWIPISAGRNQTRSIAERAREEVRRHVRTRIEAYTVRRRKEQNNLGIAGDTGISDSEDSLDELPFVRDSLLEEDLEFGLDNSTLDFDYSFTLRPVTPELTTNMANVPTGAPPIGNHVASFKVPRPWETNVPKFVTEDKDDLRDFMEQVEDIIALAQITDDQEKKCLLTGYLPSKKREMWRALTEYAAGTSYADFKKAVMKAYPEVKEDLKGTLEELEKLCAENKGIKRTEEGRLKRFGMHFRTLVHKLSQPPAIILNKSACQRYLNTLDRGFAETLRMAINTKDLIKEDLVVPNAVDHRKEDPILMDELIKMAERLANKGSSDSTWDDEGEPEVKRSDRFPAIKLERRDARLEEFGGELSSLRDALTVAQRQSKAAHDELMKAFQNSRAPAPAREDNEQREQGSRGMVSTYGADRPYNRGYGGQQPRNGCYYCDGSDHYSKECTVKAAHIQKGWIAVEDGQQRLSDGGYIPRGRGSPATRVEEYWQRKSAAGQHFNETFYNSAPEDELDTLRDEIRTLRVRLNAVTTGNSPFPQTPSQLPATPNAPVQSYVNQAAMVPTVNMEEFGRTVFNMMKMNTGPQDQLIQTRSKAKNVTFTEPPEQDF